MDVTYELRPNPLIYKDHFFFPHPPLPSTSPVLIGNCKDCTGNEFELPLHNHYMTTACHACIRGSKVKDMAGTCSKSMPST